MQPRPSDRELHTVLAALRYYQELNLLTPSGTTAGGARRYSEADVAGRRYAMGLMEAAGLKPRIDAGGNMSARWRLNGASERSRTGGLSF